MGQAIPTTDRPTTAAATASRTPRNAENGYAISNENGLCVDSNMETVNDITECELSSIQYLTKSHPRIRFQTETRSAFMPKGCFYKASLNRVFWNNHQTGRKSRRVQQICRRSKYCIIN